MRRRIQTELSEPLPTRGLDVVEVRDGEALRAFLVEWRRLVRGSGRTTAPTRSRPPYAHPGSRA